MNLSFIRISKTDALKYLGNFSNSLFNSCFVKRCKWNEGKIMKTIAAISTPYGIGGLSVVRV